MAIRLDQSDQQSEEVFSGGVHAGQATAYQRKAEEYIEAAFQKTKADIAKQVHYRDIRHRGLKNYK